MKNTTLTPTPETDFKVIDLDGPWLIDTATLSPVRPATPEEAATDPEADPFTVTVTHRVFVDHLDEPDLGGDGGDWYVDPDDDGEDEDMPIGHFVRWYLVTYLPSLAVWMAATLIGLTVFREPLQQTAATVTELTLVFFRLDAVAAAIGVGAYFLLVTALFEVWPYIAWRANR